MTHAAKRSRGSAAVPHRDAIGYAIVVISYLGMAGSAPLVAWADAPEAIILCLRMAFAALALASYSCGARCLPTGAARAPPGASS